MTAKGTSAGMARRGPSKNFMCGSPAANGGGRFEASPPNRRGLPAASERRVDRRIVRQFTREQEALRES